MTTTPLKECPCCGFSAPILTDTATLNYLEVSVSILSLVLCPADAGGCGMQSGWQNTDEEAVVAWNLRGAGMELDARTTLVADLGDVESLIKTFHSSLAEPGPHKMLLTVQKARLAIARAPVESIVADSAKLDELLNRVKRDLALPAPDGQATMELVRYIHAFGSQQRTEGYAKKVSNAECGALAMLEIERERTAALEARVKELENRPAVPSIKPQRTLEALVLEYGNTPLLGDDRKRADVMNDITALVHASSVELALTVPMQIVADANRYQHLKSFAFNRTMAGSNGPVLTWTLSLPAAEDNHASLDVAVDQERAFHREKPRYPSAPSRTEVHDASADLFELITEWARLPAGSRGDAARDIIACVNRSHLAGWLDAAVLLRELPAQVQGVVVPENWKVVPLKLTGEMRDATKGVLGFTCMYEAAVAAAPAPETASLSNYERFMATPFGQHLAKSSEIVATWPSWKRDLWGPAVGGGTATAEPEVKS